MIGIYKITNTITSQCYIGQSINIEERWKQHIYEGKILHNKTKFYLALNKYGADVFEFDVLEECPLNQNFLDERERYWIEYYNSYNNGYNSTLGGQSENSWTYNPQAIQDLWDKGYSIGEIVKMIGCSCDTARKHLQGYSDYNTHTSNSRAIQHAIAEGAQLGTPSVIYQYDLNGQYIAEYKSLKEAAKKLGHDVSSGISAVLRHKCQTAYGYQWSKEKVDSMPIVSAPQGKLVKCINTNQIFHSASEAARWCNLKGSGNIGNCCIGKRQTAGKHPQTGEPLKWEYIK